MSKIKREASPSWEDLAQHAKIIPEIKPTAVIAMLGIRQAAAGIQSAVTDVLFRDYHLSEGKFCVLVVLHQNAQGIAPSVLAEKVGVTRATVSAMLMRLSRDEMVTIATDTQDGRGKKVTLTSKGRAFMDEILPPHYLRITKLMGKLTETEQKELARLLNKLRDENTRSE